MRRKDCVYPNKKFSFIAPLAAISILTYSAFPPFTALAEINKNTNLTESQLEIYDLRSLFSNISGFVTVQENSILSQNNPETKTTKLIKIPLDPKKENALAVVPRKRIFVTATAYSSTVDQTDSTPFITANGSHVHDGTLAANFLPFGTKVRFPSLYKNKIFIVEDRMKSSHKVDLWFSTREEAKFFGVKRVEMEIL